MEKKTNIDFKWSSDRWATARTNNVDKLYELWSKEPNRAEVLDDPKLRDGHQLVIIKKQYLDLLLELQEQNAKIAADTSILFQTIDLVTALAPKENEGLGKALGLLASLKENLRMHVV